MDLVTAPIESHAHNLLPYKYLFHRTQYLNNILLACNPHYDTIVGVPHCTCDIKLICIHSGLSILMYPKMSRLPYQTLLLLYTIMINLPPSSPYILRYSIGHLTASTPLFKFVSSPPPARNQSIIDHYEIFKWVKMRPQSDRARFD